MYICYALEIIIDLPLGFPINNIITLYIFFLFLIFLVYAPIFWFLEFINGVCGLRWICCGEIVAYYVECTNVVKKWYRSDCVCVNQDY